MANLMREMNEVVRTSLLTVEEVMQRHDRNIIERREKQEAATKAAERITNELMRWHKGDRDAITGAELVSIIFDCFEYVPRQ